MSKTTADLPVLTLDKIRSRVAERRAEEATILELERLAREGRFPDISDVYTRNLQRARSPDGESPEADAAELKEDLTEAAKR